MSQHLDDGKSLYIAREGAKYYTDRKYNVFANGKNTKGETIYLAESYGANDFWDEPFASYVSEYELSETAIIHTFYLPTLGEEKNTRRAVYTGKFEYGADGRLISLAIDG